ncbi:MAG: hypothetical protein HKN35_03815 [Woeseia sp.]|nr:hypothetical protein [Woeseia sp.]MBT8097696.1 hypothetical protein [Woeseia sp.]NNE59994.1 hypothetical protein [Woeseia sp.]NNL55569.1 hypothetical protein [Woeseia sp.]
MNSGLGTAERDLLRQKFDALPDTPPPREVWERVSAQAEAEGLFRQPFGKQPQHWLVGAGLAAAVLLVAVRLPQPAFDEGSFPTEPVYMAEGDSGSLDALIVQSRLLESDLRALPNKPQVMRGGTAVTISELEDRIAAIDRVLNDRSAGLTDDETKTYWRERVRLMDSLVQVRYVQARRNSL